MSIRERLEKWSIPEPNTGCTLWFGVVNRRGYGRLHVSGRLHLAHRLSYELEHGPVPAGRLVLHKCDQTACIQATHLFVGTHRDNMADCAAKGRYAGQKKTACQHGHPLVGSNVVWRSLRGSRPYRECATCRRDTWRRSHEVNKEKRNAARKELHQRSRSNRGPR
jgi:hypothetical protein